MNKDFLIDIDMNVEMPKYEMVLCKMTEEPIQEINNVVGLEVKSYFANIDEISFSVPLYLTNDEGVKTRNELYDLIEGDMLVLLNDVQYFILTDPKVVSSNDGEISKELTGFDRAYELAKKRLSGYEAVSRMLYDPLDRQDETGLELGFLNHIENRTSWSVGYVNPNLLTKYRYLSMPKSTYLQAFQEVQRTYDCLFRFDTVNKVINVYEITQLGDHKGLYISDENFIDNLNQTINYDSIVTRLYLYGKDNISIQSVSIAGQPYIQDFSFYKDTKYMSQDLIDALDSYENFISSKEDEFSGYLASLESKTAALGRLLDELVELNTQLRVLQEEFDAIIARSESSEADRVQKQLDLSAKQSEIIDKQTEINNKKSEMSAVDAQMDSIYENVNLLKSQIDINAHFTQELKDELDSFIREDEYVDQNYTEETIQELFEDGKGVLEKVSRPKVQFEVKVEDFMQLVEGQHIWDKFILGDIVTVEHKEIGFSYDVRLVGYTRNVDNNNLTLMFSNTNSIDDENLYLKDLLDNLNTTASTVDYSKFGWYKGEEASTTINEYVNNALDLAKQSIVTAQGQRRLMDDRGIWLTKEEPDGSINLKQMRLINNVLAITNDNWSTVDTAITGDGVNAAVVRGHLGQFATISANKILMDEDNGYISFGDLVDKPWIPQNADDVGAKPASWVPTWAEIKDSPTVLSPDDIKTTVITKDWIGTLGLIVGDEIQMGSNARISWTNVDGKPTIPPAYSDTKALNAWLDSGYATHITPDGIYTGTIAANKILIGGTNGSISFLDLDDKPDVPDDEYITNITKDTVTTTYLESLNLEVGNEIKMGPNARISWDNVESKPYVPDDEYMTNITKDTVTTTYLKSLNLEVGNEIQMGPNAIITWDNLSEDSKVNLKGEDAIIWTIGSDGYWYKDGVRTGDLAVGIDGEDGAEWSIGEDGYWYKNGLKTDKKAIGEDGYTPIKGADYFDGVDGSSNYLWVRYSQNSNGDPFTTDPTNAKYIGVATTLAPNAPGHYNSYSWTLIKGQDGLKGESGEDGQSSYLHIKYSNDGGVTFTGNGGEDVGSWIGTYIDFEKEDSSNLNDYTWNKVKGDKGEDGYTPVKGTDYFDGKDGQDGESKYLWIRYSQNSNGDPFITDPTDAKYIGIATTLTNNPPSHHLSYTWSLIKGTDGIAGEDGANGQTSYLHIKYSNNGTSFTSNNGETVGAYIGTYVDFVEEDSTVFSKYTWNKVKGEDGYTPIKGTDYFDGKDGQNGESKYLWIKYSQNSSGSSPTDDPAGAKYIGIATTITNVKPTSYLSYSWSLIKGQDGLNGIKGETGPNGQTSYLHIKYSNNGTTFTSNSGETVGSWIGTYVDFVEADSTVFSRYTWNKVKGEDGKNGTNGSDANVPSYITSTKITSTDIESPSITGGTLTGGTIRTAASGRRVQMNSLGIRSYNASNQRHGFGLNTYGELELYNGGSSIGGIRYDTAGTGTTDEAKNRMFITTTRNYAMKLESSGNMSMEAPYIFMRGTNSGVRISGTLQLGAANVSGLAMSDLPLTDNNLVDSYGSSTNGKYIRFKNGTQICWISSRTLTYQNSLYLSGSWTFPSSFNETPTVVGNHHGLYDTGRISRGSFSMRPSGNTSKVSAQAILMATHENFVSGDSWTFQAYAIGLWK